MPKRVCDFCDKELKESPGLLFSPPRKDGELRRYELCRPCFKKILRIMKFSIDEIEDILSVGPAWLNYTKKVKRTVQKKSTKKE